MDISEKNFEQTIEDALLTNGYCKRTPEHYDKVLCLDPEVVINFIYATQPKEWEKLKKQHGTDVKERFFKRLTSEIHKRGTLDVLRKGIKDNGCKFSLVYFRPPTSLNKALQKLYEANFFTVIRQLKYSKKNENSLDLVLFLNGLPIFTAELKNPLTGQTVQDAIAQYKTTRDPREPLFAFGRCLAHFAIDPDIVYMTTYLQSTTTRFLPFNRGRNGGAGNPPSWKGFATAYLWERIWDKDSVLNLIQHFIQVVEEEDDKGKKTGKRSLVFPRYHQLDAVRCLVADARVHRAGKWYLIQHSAGSGKSNSIAWLAHQLSVLHDASDKRIFDSIIVITDRRVLDRQIQRTVRQFEQTLGVVENIDKTSRQLKTALEDGKTIIVTTLQKFPVIVDQIEVLPGKFFAVIIDEAHSSQSGESTKSLKAVLATGSLEEAETEEATEGDDWEDLIVAQMKRRGRLPNVSTFAFTATPKSETLELFGTRQPDGRYTPFSLYTMRQAIEEGFILDVLENYTTHKVYWSLLKKIKDDPRYDRHKAAYLLKSFMDLHEHAIAKKVTIMVEHFVEHVARRIGGRAKAMIVTRSRLHAVRYKQAVDRYLKEKDYPFKTLVAFSGTVRDRGIDYTETNMNGIPETQTAEAFKRDEYHILIVANKFQTGFDQPFLHTMYVDKKLRGVNAVQTLSRLNRVHPDKQETMVLDFTNEAEDIRKAFEPYYDRILLKEGTDPNLLYDLQTELADFHFYTTMDINHFASIYFDPKGTQDTLHAALAPVVDQYREAIEEEQVRFRGRLTDYIRLYAFLSQVISFTDADLEKLYVFCRLLQRKLPVPHDRLPVEIQQCIDMDAYRIQKTESRKIEPEYQITEFKPADYKGVYEPSVEELELLSRIIKDLNEHFGTDFSEEDRVFIQQLETKIDDNAGLEASIRVNSPENARLTFDHIVNDMIQGMIDTNFKFYKQITDNPEFGEFFLGWLFEQYLKRKNAE